MTFTLAEIPLLGGRIAISPQPGRSGTYDADFKALLAWGPDLVISLTTEAELQSQGAKDLAFDLALYGIDRLHLPITDFATPDFGDRWPALSRAFQTRLTKGHSILIHCLAGCGRSGMIALRLMVDAGQDPAQALKTLRQARPCAVATDSQRHWAQSRA